MKIVHTSPGGHKACVRMLQPVSNEEEKMFFSKLKDKNNHKSCDIFNFSISLALSGGIVSIK